MQWDFTCIAGVHVTARGRVVIIVLIGHDALVGEVARGGNHVTRAAGLVVEVGIREASRVNLASGHHSRLGPLGSLKEGMGTRKGQQERISS